MFHSKKMSIVAACLGLVFFLPGCQGPSYVNIPAATGDVAFNSPNGRTARAVVVAAVDGIVTLTPLDGPVALSLPPGAEALTHEAVANAVGSNVIPASADEAASTTAIIRVTEVRVRGHRAEVDAVRARAGGSEQLVTVSLSWATFGGWGTDHIRVWRIPVSQ